MAAEKTSIELDKTEFALIVGEEDGEMSVRVVSGSEIADDAEEMPAPAEIVLALAMRLLRDPDFHDEVIDWYYEHQDEIDDED
ncbi:MAG: hypothetical protein NT133_03115 [Alphaproteobacteria bacterium]|nr:hypothetical protein [Alphaproteobacteria bacterium]